MEVVFCCDLGPGIGIGHLMRCLALAEQYLAEGDRVRFLVDTAEVSLARHHLGLRGIDHQPPPDANDPEAWARTLVDMGAELVVIDSYLLPRELYSVVRRQLPLLALVDGDPEGRDADIHLDQNIGAETDPWPVPEGGVRLAGLDHALQRRDIRALRPADPDAHSEAEPPGVLAFFGGTDAFGIAPHVTRALVATGRPFTLQVVAARPEMQAELAAVEPAAGQRVEVIGPTDQLAELMVAADVTVAAAGTSLWELACLGSAAAVVAVAENQEQAYGRVVDEELFVGLGMLADLAADPGAAVEALTRLLDDSGQRAQLRRRAWTRVDGRGAERVVKTSREVVGRRRRG